MSVKLIRLPEVRDRVGLGRSTIYLLISRGQFPKPINIGTRSIAFLEAEIEAWVEEKVRAARGEVA